ncbi:hypothetical protein FRB98_008907, partial [Tulasnella sp. 332]
MIQRREVELVLDIRRGGEAVLLIGALWLVVWRLYELDGPIMRVPILVELVGLSVLAIIHCILGAIKTPVVLTASTLKTNDTRRQHAVTPSGTREHEMAFLWMTDVRDYSDCPDDGSVTALLFAPVLASTYWLISLQQLAAYPTSNSIPKGWLIEPPRELPPSPHHPPLSSLQSIVLSRRKLVELSVLCSTLLFIHMTYSKWQQRRRLVRHSSKTAAVNEFPPKKEGRRSWLYTKFSVIATLLCLALRLTSDIPFLSVFANLSYFDVIIISLGFQFIIYVMIRLAYQGFTLGELGLVATGSTAVLMESVNLTKARIWPFTTPFIETYRSPTPLLIYQIALIPGAFLTGFLLSPILVISRNLAQKPSHRLRFPDQKPPFRKALAAAFYGFTILIVGGLIGSWTGWCLGAADSTHPVAKMAGSGSSRNPWTWFAVWILQGQRPWSRPALLVYWGIVASISVAGWSRQLARARKSGGKIINVHFSGTSTTHNPGNPSAISSVITNGDSRVRSGSRSASDGSIRPKLKETGSSSTALNGLASPSTMTHSMTELLDRADKRVPTLSLNARRKFFHGLAVVMFVPGIALDPAFSHASFSVAFSLFIFVEYVRYFALYPFSAPVHVFMNEFINEKDSGTAILSHFYLLTGCAMPIWLEGPSGVLGFTGVLALGVGDAVASIIGKRFGRHQWTNNSPKTVEGTLGFVVSTVAVAWFLKAIGVTEAFS